MFKNIQKIGFGLLSSLWVNSLSFGLECPKAQDFQTVIQVPPHEFHPQIGQIEFFSLASNFMVNEEHENLNNDWVMIFNSKVEPEQLTQNFSVNLIQNMNILTKNAYDFALNDKNKIQYCLYQSSESPQVGAIAYHVPKGFKTSNQAHLQHFIRSISF